MSVVPCGAKWLSMTQTAGERAWMVGGIGSSGREAIYRAGQDIESGGALVRLCKGGGERFLAGYLVGVGGGGGEEVQRDTRQGLKDEDGDSLFTTVDDFKQETK